MNQINTEELASSLWRQVFDPHNEELHRVAYRDRSEETPVSVEKGLGLVDSDNRPLMVRLSRPLTMKGADKVRLDTNFGEHVTIMSSEELTDALDRFITLDLNSVSARTHDDAPSKWYEDHSFSIAT